MNEFKIEMFGYRAVTTRTEIGFWALLTSRRCWWNSSQQEKSRKEWRTWSERSTRTETASSVLERWANNRYLKLPVINHPLSRVSGATSDGRIQIAVRF